MEKIGMKYEGYLRQYIKKWDKFEDCKIFSILKDEYIPDRKYNSEMVNE